MDPLSALGVAGNIVQFVQFTFSLLNNSKKIYKSSSGISADSENLEYIHIKLTTFSDQLLNSNFQSTSPGSNNASELQEIARSCKDDCSKLLELIDRLRRKSNASRKWWDSFSKAVLELWTTKDLEYLKTRITEARSLIILKLCTISCESIAASSTELLGLRADMNEAWLSRTRHSNDLLQSMKELQLKVEHIKSSVVDLATLTINRDLEERELKLLTKQVESLSLSGTQFSKGNALLQSLDFDKRPVRHGSIPEAHEKTFRWILDTSSSGDTPGDRFVDWLKGDQNVFWISGKAGSGKSTLMKFVAGSRETPCFLKHWAGPKKLVLASHYFWNPGSEIQRSREGLLRSLLFDILIQSPEIMNVVCEDLWRDMNPFHIKSLVWDSSHLKTALFKVAQIEDLPARICFFIDGLDEYEGDQLELCRDIRDLSSSRDIKMCLSSRPWNVFEDSFGMNSQQKLYIHELTRADILNYSEKRLYDHPRWLNESVDQNLLSHLINQITDRAQGVFLWVFLVTRMLREGLANHDSLSDLTKRLEGLPTDLEVFFKHILSSVEPFYHEKMAGTLCVAVKASSPLHLWIYGFHELEYADSDYSLKLPIAAMDEYQVQVFQDSTARRLNGWCKGLIERRADHVEFIHRTVRDFLRTDEMTEFLKQKAPVQFCASLSLLRSHWAKTKSSPPISATEQSDDRVLFNKIWRDALIWASVAQHENLHVQDECERQLDDMEESLYQSHPSLAMPHRHRSFRVLFREHIIRLGLIDYTSRKLRQDINYFAECDRAPLSIATDYFTKALRDASFEVKQSCRMLKTLLNHGSDPNEMLHGGHGRPKSTPWADFISIFLSCMCSLEDSTTSYFRVDRRQEIMFTEVQSEDLFTAFLDHSSDVNAVILCDHCDEPQSRIFWIIWLFFGFAMPRLQQQADKYLKDLKRILSSDIHWDQIHVAVRHDPVGKRKLKPEISTKLDEAMSDLMNESVNASATNDTPWSILCSFVTRISEDEARIAKEKQQGFLGQIVLTFIEAAQAHSLQWDDMLPALEKMLPSNLYFQVLGALGRPVEVSLPVIRRRARKLSNVSHEDVPVPKKARKL